MSQGNKRCDWCDEACWPGKTLPDGDKLCTACFKERRSDTRGFPDCPFCKHRYWLIQIQSWGFRCLGCGVKFAGAVRDEEHEEWRPNRWHPYDRDHLDRD